MATTVTKLTQVLLCIPEASLDKCLKDHLKVSKWHCDVVHTGKAAQLKLHGGRYAAVFLDLDIRQHSGIEVLRYIRSTCVQTRVVLLASDQERLATLGLDAGELTRMGVHDTLLGPLDPDRLCGFLEQLYRHRAWTGVETRQVTAEEERSEEVLADGRFVRVRTEEFFGGSVAVFDIWLRLGQGRYLKAIHRGEPFDVARLERWAQREQGEWLYFLADDRAAFLNYLNEVAAKVLANPAYGVKEGVAAVKTVSDLYLQEIHVNGFRPEMVAEGRQLCESVLALAKRDRELAKMLREAEETDPEAYSETFLASFFSSMIVSKMPWGGASTVEKTVLGALLCDLGKLRLPKELREARESDLEGEKLREWRRHPEYGVAMLDPFPWVQEAVKQVVYQHHELVNGGGFPNGLSGLRMYPLAKIVSFASDFARFLREERLAPVPGLRSFLLSPGGLECYDQEVVRAFLGCFAAKEKTK